MTRSNENPPTGSKQHRMVFHTPVGVFCSAWGENDYNELRQFVTRVINGDMDQVNFRGDGGLRICLAKNTLVNCVCVLESREVEEAGADPSRVQALNELAADAQELKMGY